MAFLILAGESFAAAPQVYRSGSYPDYLVGQTVSLTVATSPAQPNAGIYQFRHKNGQPDGPQPTLVGYTDSQGRYLLTATIEPEWVGVYTNERFAVGSATSPQSSPLNYTVTMPSSNAPTVTRSSPYPNYLAGQTATLSISTSPNQPYAPVYQFRHKDGQPDGPQPTLVAYTDGFGRYNLTATVEPEWAGVYSNERFAVGSPTGPQSTPLSYTVSASTEGTIGIFYLGDCNGCTSVQRELKALQVLNQLGQSGAHHVVFYDAFYGAHEEFMIDREFEPELGTWRELIWRRGAPAPALIAAIDNVANQLVAFNDNLLPFVVDSEGPSEEGGREEKSTTDDDFDSEWNTLDLRGLQVKDSITSIAEMDSVFMDDLDTRLKELGLVPENLRRGIQETGHSVAQSSSIALMTGSSHAVAWAVGFEAALRAIIKAGFDRTETNTTLTRITDTQGTSISNHYSETSYLRIRIRVEDPDSLEPGHLIVRYNLDPSAGPTDRFLLEKASGPGGSRLPFDALGNVDPSLISRPVRTLIADVGWWRQYAQFFGVSFGSCLPTVNHRCRLTVID